MSKYELTPEQIQHELAATAATLPIYSRLPALFTNGKMFDSYDRFESEGFQLVEHSENKIMSGSHKSARGYLFKKYNNDKDVADQLRNYMFRIEGARLLRSFITEHGFAGVVTPQKWLYELPSSFPAPHLVVAEKLDLVSRTDTERNYARISKEQTRELATVLYYFRGLNSTAANLPFTEDGKIAFIDTERWHHDKDYLRKVGERLTIDRRKLAEDIFDDLRRQGARPFETSYLKEGRRRRQREDDFEREEDTSSSSSSSPSTQPRSAAAPTRAAAWCRARQSRRRQASSTPETQPPPSSSLGRSRRRS
jgi:hypothetical protein